jgi:ABC-type transport system substrate-binding protein
VNPARARLWRRWPCALLVVLLVLLLVAAGCARRHASSGKKVFTFYRSSAHKSLDPVKQFDTASAELIANVYDSLLQYAYLERPYQLEPNLLTKMPELSADGLRYSFELRDDAIFADDRCFPGGKGRKLVADDVIYSFKRFADANQNAKSYTLLHDTIKGMDEFRAETKRLGPARTNYRALRIAGLQKQDDRHFTIELVRPNPLALLPLAATQLAIVAHEAVEHYKEGFVSHPVGTGPFRIKTLSRRGVTVLVKNPHYHQRYPTRGEPSDVTSGRLADAGKRLPLLDEVQLPLIEETQPAMLKFMFGQLDWVAMDRDNFVKLAYKDASGFHLRKEYAGKYRIYSEPTLASEYFTLNMKDPLLGKNKALRQALAYAFDAQGYIDQMLNGRGTALTSIVPVPIAGSQRDVPSTWYAHDVAMAKRKLAEAGYPGGKGLPELVMEYRLSDKTTRQEYEFNRASLAAAGIRLKGNFQPFSAFLEKVEVTGNFQMTSQGWQADYPDAENFYQLLYGPNGVPGTNASNYENPEFDKLYEQTRFMPNGPQRYALFARMNEMLREDVPMIISFSPTVVGLVQPWVKNFKRHMMIDMPFQYLDVDPSQRVIGRR